MLNFELINTTNDHNFDLFNVENLIPYERDLYVSLIHKYMSEKYKATE